MTKFLIAASLVAFSFSSVSYAKVSKKEHKAFTKACKAENPSATKKEIKACVAAKAAGGGAQ